MVLMNWILIGNGDQYIIGRALPYLKKFSWDGASLKCYKCDGPIHV